MTSRTNPQNFPDHAFVPAYRARRNAEATLRGDPEYALLPSEIDWSNRFDSLKQQGYVLRRRYDPEWVPSWLGPQAHIEPWFCEDYIKQGKPNVLDASRVLDGQCVAIKSIPRSGEGSQELQIARMVSSLPGVENHCLYLIDVLNDPLDDQRMLLVMPHLLQYDTPAFETRMDVVSYVSQTLEGLAFLHRHRIAHRDISSAKIMMDAEKLFPNGHHPVRWWTLPDASFGQGRERRADHQGEVRYYYVDFEHSAHFPEGTEPLVTRSRVRDQDPPELSGDEPFYAFKADVYALGRVYEKEFLQLYRNVAFLELLVTHMTQPDPDVRPPAEELVKMFQQLWALETDAALRGRLVERSETTTVKVGLDVLMAIDNGIHMYRRLVGP